jgi:hypothetical protein
MVWPSLYAQQPPRQLQIGLVYTQRLTRATNCVPAMVVFFLISPAVKALVTTCRRQGQLQHMYHMSYTRTHAPNRDGASRCHQPLYA